MKLAKRKTTMPTRRSSYWDPLVSMFDEDIDPFSSIDRLLGEPFFGALGGYRDIRANVIRTETGSRIEIEAPGMSKEDFNVQVQDDVMTISAQVENQKEERGRREFRQQSFSRSWTLPEGVKKAEISAAYEAGILRVDVPHEAPKVQESDAWVIDIK